MFVRDNIKLATRNFKTRKLRTFLTILGISVGIGTILFLVSLGYGLQKVLLEGIATSDTLLTLDITPSDSNILKMDDKTIDYFSHLSEVAEISPAKTVSSQFEINGIVSNVTLDSVPENYFRLSGIKLLEGEPFKDKKSNSVVVSEGALKSLGIDSLKDSIGKEVAISLIIPKEESSGKEGDLIKEGDVIYFDSNFAISGVVEDPTNSFAFIPSGWIEATPAAGSYDMIKVKAQNQSFIEPIRGKAIEKGCTVAAISDTIDQANKIFNTVQIVLAMFGVVALIVSAIGMFNTMTIALLERTVEIGIMKTLGATSREIKFLFLTESFIIGLLGGAGGVLIGILGCRVVNMIFNVLASNLGGKSLNIFYTPSWFILLVLVFSSLVGVITGVYPARRAAKLSSLEAFRYK